MDEQRLWAPWRIEHIQGSGETKPTLQPTALRAGAESDCFLCRAAGEYEDAEAAQRQNRVVKFGSEVLVILNKYPYSNGHLMVSPLRHVGELHQLTSAQHLEAMEMLAHYTQVLTETFNAEGFNIGLNLGRVAGAGLPGHLHWHLVPRWTGDKNFMPTLAGTQVISQSLDAAWQALVADDQVED